MSVHEFRSFGEILKARATEHAGQRAFVFLDRHGNVSDERTYAKLDERARTIASELAALGFGGKPVLLVFPPGLDFVDALFGCFYAGCIAVPAPYLSGKRVGERITAICDDCRPAAVLTLSRFENDAEIRGAVFRRFAELAVLSVDRFGAVAQAATPRSTHVDDLALLQYTSGSIGAPKGVMLSHGNLIANSAMIRDAFGHNGRSRGVSWLPLFHDMGLIGHVLQPVYVSALSVLMSPLSFLQRPLTWLQAISDWQATTSGGPNNAFDLCARLIRPEQAAHLDLRSWSVAYCGAETVRADVLEGFASKFAGNGFRREALYPCYGLAEATLMVTGGAAGSGMHTTVAGTRRVVGCGRTWHGTTLRIVDPHSSSAVADGATGEIWVAGPNVGRGYWQKPEESRAAFEARLGADQTRYLRTGDLGFVERGELFVVGRIKDMIIVGGSNHAPEDVEATIAMSHAFPGPACAAFGFDDGAGEQVVVVQEISRRARDGGDLDAAVMAACAAVTREHGLRLDDFVLVAPGALPRTSSGKIRRGRCREMYQASEFERLNAYSVSLPLKAGAALEIE